MTRRAAALLLPLLIAAPAFAAAPPAADFAAACAALPDGATLRLRLLDGTIVEGRAAGWDGVRLCLMRPDGVAAEGDGSVAAALWVRERQTVGGLKHGALIGGIAGGVGALGLVALFSSIDDDGLDGGAAVTLLMMGLGGGAGVGALVGGIAGSSLPDWELLWARPGWSAPPGRSPADLQPSTGGLELLLGTSHADTGSERSGPACGLRWRSTLSPRWSAALEAAWYRAESARQYPVDPSVPHAYEDDCRHAGALLQCDLATGNLRPYLVGGLGVYWWQENFLGYGWGGGLAGNLGRRAVWRLEWRRHGNLQRLVETEPGLTSFLIGVGRTW